MGTHYFFGYGSLVNRATHDYAPGHPARVTGWRRVWRCAPSRPVSFLTVEPDSACAIDGLIAAVPGNDWAALDAREFSYDRRPITRQVHHDAQGVNTVSIYAIGHERSRAPDADHPVLLSYIDAVIQGFLREYGAAGARHFVETTDGWQAPVYDDRAAPRYPRAQPLDADERAHVDGLLAELGVQRIA